MNPRYVVEIGMGNGLATLFMKAYMSNLSLLLTINHDNYNCQGPGHSIFKKKDFDQDEIIQLNLDISLPNYLEMVLLRITDADLIRFKLADGLLVWKILDFLETVKNGCQMIMVIKNIKLWSIARVWDKISIPRIIDLTSFGYANGVGLMHCSAISFY